MHDEWTDKLSEFLDGELPADEQRAVDAHLRGCADCAAVLAKNLKEEEATDKKLSQLGESTVNLQAAE